MVIGALNIAVDIDRDSEASGLQAVCAFAEQHPAAIEPLQAVHLAKAGYVIVRFVTEQHGLLLRLKPSAAMQRVIRAFAGQQAVETVLEAYGVDLDLRVAA